MIREEDIAIAERILLHSGEFFNADKREFILCEDSKDLVACAGSGKTTALIAKLLILQEKLPFENNKGICVLTHTNIGVDEIKRGNYANKLLGHRNSFVGTIQEFVNRFLGIPAFKYKFGTPPKFIDNEPVKRSLLAKLRVSQDAKSYLYGQAQRSQLSAEEILTEGLCFKFGQNKEVIYTKGVNGPTKLSDPNTRSYKAIHQMKYSILEDGFLNYEDSYSLAFWFLEKFPFYKEIIASRFKYIFIDEMQDTSNYQADILDIIFNPEQHIIQRIGDPNQAIHNSSPQQGGWRIRSGNLALKNSQRLPTNICEAIKNIRFDSREEIQGTERKTLIPTYLLLFNEGEETAVLPMFENILDEKSVELELCEKDKIRVIAWNCNPETSSGENIQKFFPRFTKSKNLESSYLPNLKSYLISSKSSGFKRNIGTCSSLIMEIYSRFLYEQGVKIEDRHPTSHRIYAALRNDDQFKNQLLVFSLLLSGGNDIEEAVKAYLEGPLLNTFSQSISINQNAKKFLNDQHISETLGANHSEPSNVYGHFRGIPITMSSIHGVKGETVKALLYLETKVFVHDLESILKYLCGGNKPNPIPPREAYKLKMCYVGLSRASHLLCLAIRKTAVSQEDRGKLSQLGWEIVEV